MNTIKTTNTKTHPVATMLVHPEVVRTITGTLLNFGVPRQDLEDGVAEVQMQTLKYLRNRPHPVDLAEWKALCATITKNWRLKENEKDEVRAKYDAGLCEEPDAHAPLPVGLGERESVDGGRLVKMLETQFDAGAMPPRGDEILDCVQAGMTYEEIGDELGISAEAVRSRMRQMRKRFAEKLAMLGIAVTVLLVILLATGPLTIALPTAPPAPPTLVPRPPPRPDPSVLARTLRAQAAQECEQHRWAECLAKLDEARALDAAGEEDAAVVTLRLRARDAVADEEMMPFRAKGP